jgi:trigger factor
MSVTNCETLEKSRVALTVSVGEADFQAAVEKAYKKQRGRINMHGFRPGKAPRKMIEKVYGPEVFYEEAINIALPDAYAEAVKEKELSVVGYPEVELLEVNKEGFSFKATVAVFPEMTLGQYKGIEVPKAEVNITDEDVDNRLKEMADRNSRMVSVERPLEKGDTANIDFEGFDQGVPFEGGKGEHFDLEIGSGSFVPGFEDQLVGMEIGQEKDIDITFPQEYHENLAGKAVVFHVKLNGIQVKETPELDDEFAKDVSEFDTIVELKEDVKAKLTAEREEAAKRAFEDIAMEKVADNMTGEIPDAMIDEQAERFVENFKMQVQSQGIPFEQYMKMTNMDEATLRQQAQAPATRQVRLDLAVGAVIKAEGLTATEEELQAEYEKTAQQYSMDVENVKKYLTEDVIREQVLRAKAIALVVDSAVAVKPELKADSAEAAETAEAAEAPEKPKRTRKTTKKAKEAEEAKEAEAEGGEQ